MYWGIYSLLSLENVMVNLHMVHVMMCMKLNTYTLDELPYTIGQ